MKENNKIPCYPEDYPEDPLGQDEEPVVELINYLMQILESAENLNDTATAARMKRMIEKIFYIQQLRQIFKRAKNSKEVCRLIGLSRNAVYARLESVGFLNVRNHLDMFLTKHTLDDLIKKSEICGPVAKQIINSRGNYSSFLEANEQDE